MSGIINMNLIPSPICCHEQAIKLLGDNEQEFSAKGVRPNVILDGCKVPFFLFFFSSDLTLIVVLFDVHFRIARAAVKPCLKFAATSWASCPLSISFRSITVNLTRPLGSKSVPSVSNDPQSLPFFFLFLSPQFSQSTPITSINDGPNDDDQHTHRQWKKKKSKNKSSFSYSLTHKSTGPR